MPRITASFMASTSSQGPVPHLVLKQLHQFVITTFPNGSAKRSSSNFICPHQYYSSNQMFVDHLVWFVQQNRKFEHYRHHQVVLAAFLKGCHFCGCCRNAMITCAGFLSDLLINAHSNESYGIHFLSLIHLLAHRSS